MRGRLPAIGLLLGVGAAGMYFAGRAGGTGATVAAALALACALVLVVLAEPASVEAPPVSRVFDAALLVLPAALTLYLSFNSGGYFPAAPAVAALALTVVLVLRLTLVDHPFAGWSRPLAAAAGALALHAIWVLASAGWSDAPSRALVEFDRALLYLLALVVAGSVPRTSARLRWMLGGLGLAIVAVAVAALATRLFADEFPTFRNLGNQQLSHPLTYSNSLGILCGLGMVLGLHLASSLRERVAVRVAAAAAMPVLATALYLTLSRGPVFAVAGGLAVYALLGRPRGLLTALLATVPTCVVAVRTAYDNELLTTVDPSTPAALAQGEHVAGVLVLCVLASAFVRLLLVPVDQRLDRVSLPLHRRRAVLTTGWAGAAVAAVAVALAAGAPGWVADRYDRFVETDQPTTGGDLRRSVLEGGNRGLLDNWDVALTAFSDDPVRGQGAGAFEVFWNQRRPVEQAEAAYDVTDAHSLYLETLGELGLVGALTLLVALGAIALAFQPLRRGRDRSLYAALFALALTWLAHAGVEWDWEMPAVTIWLFALGGAALASRERAAVRSVPSQGVRVGAGLALLVAAVAPGLVLASQLQLDESVAAFARDDCPRSVERAAASIETLEVRPEPYEVIALCQARRGDFRRAADGMRRAADRDPGNWRYRYGLAVARAAAGLDPVPALRQAARLNPHSAVVEELARQLRDGGPQRWREIGEPLARAGRPTVFR